MTIALERHRAGRALVSSARAAIALALGVGLVACGASSRGAAAAPRGHGMPQRATTTPPRAPAPASSVPSAGRRLDVRTARFRLPAPSSRAVVFAVGNMLELVGGLRPDGTSSRQMVLLDPATGATRLTGRLAVATHDAAGAQLGKQAFVFGGGQTASVAAIQRIGAGGSRVLPAALPSPRSDLAAVVLAGRAYLVGGYDGTSWSAAVLATSDGRRFTTVATLPVPVRYPAVAAAGSSVWILGGETPRGATAAVQRIDLSSGRVSVVARLPYPVTDASAVVLDGILLLCGGRISGRPTSLITRVDPTTGRTRTVGRLPMPLADSAAVVQHGTAYLLGGEDPTPTTTVVSLRVVAAHGTGDLP